MEDGATFRNGDRTLAEKVETIREVLRSEYLKRHKDPWIFAFSGGKDSTLLLHLAYEAILSVPEERRFRELYVVANDTLVESPLVVNHLDKSLEEIRVGATNDKLPITIQKTKPNIDETFWVNVIGKGYIPPTRNFRWCTDRMKIKPTSAVLQRIMMRHNRAVLLIGTRRAESTNRQRNMDKRGVKANKMNAHNEIAGCRVFAPLADLADNDVWTILMQLPAPWQASHKSLIALYKNAGGGECPLVLTKDDAPSCGTTSPRFGCWTCTVINKDRSLLGLINSGQSEENELEELADFRDWLIELREDNKNRMSVRRNGTSKMREDGSLVYGPFTMKVRKKILKRLRELSAKIGKQLISDSEVDIIEEIWRIDEIQESGRRTLVDSLALMEA